jgi:hypothetical protein
MDSQTHSTMLPIDKLMILEIFIRMEHSLRQISLYYAHFYQFKSIVACKGNKQPKKQAG